MIFSFQSYRLSSIGSPTFISPISDPIGLIQRTESLSSFHFDDFSCRELIENVDVVVGTPERVKRSSESIGYSLSLDMLRIL